MRRNNTIYTMSVLALFLAIMLIFGFTPIGTIYIGSSFSITLMGIPVAIIASLYGSWGGLLAGTVWGIISMIQGLFISGEGVAYMQYNAVGYVLLCLPTRMLVGFLSGLFYELVRKLDHKGYVASLVSSISVPVLNTALFMSVCYLFYSDLVAVLDNGSKAGFLAFVFSAVSINFAIELASNAVVGSAAAYGVKKAADKMGLRSVFPNLVHYPSVKETVAKEEEKKPEEEDLYAKYSAKPGDGTK